MLYIYIYIYHRLRNRNDWLYEVKDNHIVVTCNHDTVTKSLELNGTGILHIKNNCRGFTSNELLIPSGSNQDNIYHDWTPGLNKLYYTLPVEILKTYVVQDIFYKNNLYIIYDVSINNNNVETARSLKNEK